MILENFGARNRGRTGDVQRGNIMFSILMTTGYRISGSDQRKREDWWELYTARLTRVILPAKMTRANTGQHYSLGEKY
jgi:hypothetical protein